MSRTLRAAQVIVPPDRVLAYRRALAAFSSGVHQAGGHVWLFRGRGTDDRYFEFCEMPTTAVLDAHTARQGIALRELVTYDHDADVMWDEVTIEPAGE